MSATKTRRKSLLNLRGSAIIIDGLLLLIPVLAIDYALSRLWPHRGFFWSHGTTTSTSDGSSTSVGGGLGLPGSLMAVALVLSYFFVMEATRGQTIGKRRYGLRVQSASGGPPSLNAISGRTVLRLIDQLPVLYLVGTLVALLTGRRRRRLGDWVAGTVVVREDEARLAAQPAVGAQPQGVPAPPAPPPPSAPGDLPATPAVVHAFTAVPATATGMPPMAGAMPPTAGALPHSTATPPGTASAVGVPPNTPLPAPAAIVVQAGALGRGRSGRDWRVVAYPLSWVAAVLIATFALGLGQAEGAAERAVALVHEYVQAREEGNAALACSLLTLAQQRELAALQGAGYQSATTGDCPGYILGSDPRSHLLSPQLSGLVAAGLTVAYESPTVVALASRADPAFQLVAVTEDGRLRLDVRGLERAGFVGECEQGGLLTADQCGCTFDRLRAEGAVPEDAQQVTASWRRKAQVAANQCRGYSGGGSE
jgi:uncharacterized RDD family membrane protein YckC